VKDIPYILEDITNTTRADDKEVFKNFEQTYLVEQYLEGKVVSVDGLVKDSNVLIVGMVEFVMGPEPWFVQEANYIPPRLDESIILQCENMARAIIQALEFDNCGFHCELRITKSGPVLVEIAARLPGGPLQPGYKRAYGLDLTALLVDLWLGKSISIEKKQINYIAQKAVFPTRTGTIKSIKGIDEAKYNTGVWDFVGIVKEGEVVTYYPKMPVPFYYFAAEAETPNKLEDIVDSIENTVIVDY
jgi:biotin carboxylase